MYVLKRECLYSTFLNYFLLCMVYSKAMACSLSDDGNEGMLGFIVHAKRVGGDVIRI